MDSQKRTSFQNRILELYDLLLLQEIWTEKDYLEEVNIIKDIKDERLEKHFKRLYALTRGGDDY